MNPTRSILALALAASALPAIAQAPAAAPAAPAPAAPAAAAPAAAAPAPKAAAAADAFAPTGEVRIRLSASFDATRVRGPNTNLSVRSDGRWGGTLAGQSVRLQVTPTRISGGGVTLTVAKEADRLTVQGNAASGARVRIVATKTSIDAQVGKRTFNATRDADGNWRQANQAAGATNFRFTGTAADPLAAPMPQWVFAVIGAL